MHFEFDSHSFAEKYNYSGKLGATCSGNETTFRLWAPTAEKVFLNIYKEPSKRSDEDIIRQPMSLLGNGVFFASFKRNYHGWYYTYSVRHSFGIEVETIDPYALSSGLNGKKGMIVDLKSASINPCGWDNDCPVRLKQYTDAVIYETHVRDFSAKLNLKEKKKFLAFTIDGLKTAAGSSAGLAHLKELGITHVHLLPVAEPASVDQGSLDKEDYNSYNWGYDPYNYNVPSGVYASNPADGNLKILELRKLVMALHSAGIGVIFDVVYNHTYSLDCALAHTVPGYYHRRDADGRLSDGSGCGNELASERPMCRRYIIDSLVWWAEGFHADGFRFDLMALTDIDTMSEIEKKLHGINPSIIIYGEGWTGGRSALSARQLSDKWNICRLTPSSGAAGPVAVFTDIVRDGIKGPVFDAKEGGYVNGRAYENMLKVKFASMGGVSPNFGTNWVASSASCSINYVSAHDNLSLFDKLTLTCSNQTERVKRNILAAAILFTSRGIPFFQAGEEFLRTKKKASGMPDENSYKSPDSINGIDWTLKDTKDGKEVFEEYKKLIALRKSHPLLRISDAVEIERATRFFIYRYDVIAYMLSGAEEELFIVYNPLNSLEIDLPKGRWKMIYGKETGKMFSGKCDVPEISCLVFEKE